MTDGEDMIRSDKNAWRELWRRPMEGDHRAVAGDQVSRVTDQEIVLLTRVLEIRKVELGLQVQWGFLFLDIP